MEVLVVVARVEPAARAERETRPLHLQAKATMEEREAPLTCLVEAVVEQVRLVEPYLVRRLVLAVTAPHPPFLDLL
jgi:hypothetical protein